MDPRRVADVMLAAAVRAAADVVYIEPDHANPETYTITFERVQKVIAKVSLDGASGAATIARLAFLGDLDLAAGHATHALVPVRSGEREADVVITLRPGDALRAELAVVQKRRAQAVVRPAAVGKVGDIIQSYRIVERLGEGGMGVVFRVEHLLLGRTYALKELRARMFERDPSASARFLREARAASRVRHPNIVDVFDFGYLADGRPFFVMELVEGESLMARVEANGTLPPAEVVTIIRQMATALAAVHDHGVIHGDVTPSNAIVLAGDTLHVKLVDFGLAAVAGEGLANDDPEMVHGTPSYISPEQLRGLPATDRSDQYSLGAVMFKLLTGHAPFEAPDLHEVCLMHLNDPVPELDSPHGPLPPRLVDIVRTCLQKSPASRFPSMRALLAALDEVEKVTDRRGWRKWLST